MLTPEEQQELAELEFELEAAADRAAKASERLENLKERAKTPFQRLVEQYEDALDNPELSELDELDPEARFLMVERNLRSSGYYLTTGDHKVDLYWGHANNEYAEDWELIGITDLHSDITYLPTLEIISWREV